MRCGVGHSLSLNPRLLWLWCRLAAVALIQVLAWEFPYASGKALKSEKTKKKKKKERKKKEKRRKMRGEKKEYSLLFGELGQD